MKFTVNFFPDGAGVGVTFAYTGQGGNEIRFQMGCNGFDNLHNELAKGLLNRINQAGDVYIHGGKEYDYQAFLAEIKKNPPSIRAK